MPSPISPASPQSRPLSREATAPSASAATAQRHAASRRRRSPRASTISAAPSAEPTRCEDSITANGATSRSASVRGSVAGRAPENRSTAPASTHRPAASGGTSGAARSDSACARAAAPSRCPRHHVKAMPMAATTNGRT